MWWFSLRGIPLLPAGLAVVALAALAGCGFHPLYANHGTSGLDQELAAIKVSPVAERVGQMLVITLRHDFNPSGAHVEPRYALTIVMSTSVGDFAIRQDGTPSRELYGASSSFALQDVTTNTLLLTGTARAYDSYDVGANPFTTIVANQDADKKAAQSMSQQIETQIATFLRRRAAS